MIGDVITEDGVARGRRWRRRWGRGGEERGKLSTGGSGGGVEEGGVGTENEGR